MIIRGEESIAEGLCHEELLQHGVHVADLTEIANSEIIFTCFLFTLWTEIPCRWNMEEILRTRSKRSISSYTRRLGITARHIQSATCIEIDIILEC